MERKISQMRESSATRSSATSVRTDVPDRNTTRTSERPITLKASRNSRHMLSEVMRFEDDGTTGNRKTVVALP